jgi:hypothetical protein
MLKETGFSQFYNIMRKYNHRSSEESANVNKGRSLERAVRFIQETILNKKPEFKGAEFTVETNKIVKESDVHHEIDVFVTVHPNTPYQSVYIFECKNWQKPVGKGQISEFADKVAAIGAARGFFVAKELTKDALARIAVDKRLTYISCSDDFESPLNIELMHAVHDLFPIRIHLKQRGVEPLNPPRILDGKSAFLFIDREVVSLTSFIKEQVDDLVFQDQKQNQSKYRNVSWHWGHSGVKIEFDLGECYLNDREIEWLGVYFYFWVEVKSQKIVSRFQLEGQGRAYSFEPFEDIISGHVIQIDVVQLI